MIEIPTPSSTAYCSGMINVKMKVTIIAAIDVLPVPQIARISAGFTI